MRIRKLHAWNLNYRRAVAVQEAWRPRLKQRPLQRELTLVAGADVSYSKHENELYAGVVVMSLPELEVVEEVTVRGAASFPYIPGLLSFRELPMLSKAFEKIRHKPDAVLYDGHGIAHPRRFGIAAHLGVLLQIPTVGCAKSLLAGEFAPVPKRRWAYSDLMLEGEVVGAVLRTKKDVKPIFVSPGHLIDLSGCISLVKMCTTRYRLPEPTRQAHLRVNAFRRESSARGGKSPFGDRN